jgi:hypothetical protein
VSDDAAFELLENRLSTGEYLVVREDARWVVAGLSIDPRTRRSWQAGSVDSLARMSAAIHSAPRSEILDRIAAACRANDTKLELDEFELESEEEVPKLAMLDVTGTSLRAKLPKSLLRKKGLTIKGGQGEAVW